MSPAEIEKWVSDAATAFAAAGDLDSLKLARLAHLGDKAPISLASRGLGSLAPEEKASAGKLIGEAKAAIAASLDQATEKLEAERDAKVLLEEVVDITLPVNRTHRGGLHPITIIKNEISDFFIEQGYAVEEGPELESGWLNFDALNIPADHPARTMQDTFYIEPVESGMVLRTQTSPVQIRSMLQHEPPIYMICPGRTFRADELDATHSPVFHQVEGLVVDKGITMAHLKGTLDNFAQAMFGPDVTTRLRPSFFPFTEPSAEVDIFFNGRWIEWGG
jgi:phenylalanyl-tRNA synthetase alpha chain